MDNTFSHHPHFTDEEPEMGQGGRGHTASKWTLWNKNPGGYDFNQYTIPASEGRNCSEDFTGEMKKLLMEAVHMLSSLRQR